MQKTATVHNPMGYENVSSYLDRHGRRRWRYRKAGQVFQLGTEYDSPDFHGRMDLAKLGKSPSDTVEDNLSGAFFSALQGNIVVEHSTGFSQDIHQGTGGPTKLVLDEFRDVEFKASPIAKPKSKRRSIASVERIEAIIALGQRRGITPIKVSQLPDGTTEVHFDGGTVLPKTKAKGWDI